uniref:SCP domain-containing protein n=1 Tax=Strongyloides papillosus TaxID=174720 RepID=A0A0N5BQW6_STREA
MRIFYNNCYISIIILCKLLFQNQALENNAKSEDKTSLDSIQNYESLRNFVKRDAIISPIAEVKENEYLGKREVSKKEEKKVVKKKKSKKSSNKKKPSKKKIKKPKSSTTTKSTTITSTTTISTTTTTKPDEFGERKSQVYKKIDDLRFNYRAKKLIINDELAKLAQNLSDRTASGRLKRFKNVSNKNNSLGAVVYQVKTSDEYNPFTKWTLGAPFIDYNNPEKYPAGGDFTQLIWSSTTHIGCGISKTPSKSKIVTICLLYPKGNINGQFAKNIHKSIYKIH